MHGYATGRVQVMVFGTWLINGGNDFRPRDVGQAKVCHVDVPEHLCGSALSVPGDGAVVVLELLGCDGLVFSSLGHEQQELVRCNVCHRN